MPAMWMDVDAQLDEVPVNILALIDDTDFKTREESVVFNQAGLDLVWNFTNTNGDTTQTAVTPTDGGDYNWTNLGNGMYAIALPDTGGASIDNDTEGFGWFSGFATGILPWSGPVIGFRDPALNAALIDDAFDTVRGLGSPTAIANAAADAPGGFPVSDAGGLDLDTLLGVLTSLAAETRSANLLDQFKTTIAVIESQRGSHTHQPGTGAILFIDSDNGDTHANGNRGGVSDPYLTHADAQTNAGSDYGHDLYIFVAGASGASSTHTETITVSNGYSFLRGPGRDQILTSSGAVNTINITADGCEISGFQITSDPTTGQDAVNVVTADFHRVHDCWFLDSRGDGIHLERSSNCQIHDNHFEGTGTLGSGQGIHITGSGGAGNANDNVIHNNHFADTDGTAILIDGGTTDDTQIHHNEIHNAGAGGTGFGIDITASSDKALVHDNFLGNNADGNIRDNGTTSVISNNEQWAKQSLLVYGHFAIHIDTVSGASGAVEGTNGTRGNPVDNLADAVTLNGLLGFDHYHLHGASSITLVSAHPNFVFEGQNGATVDLGGVNTAGSHFECLTITGDADGNDITTRLCKLQSLTNFIADAQWCLLIDNVTESAGDHYWIQCASGVAGPSTPHIDVDGDDVNARNNHIRGWLGGLELRTHTSTDLTSFDCPAGQLVVAASGTGGTIAARGNIDVTDNASEAVTILENPVVNMGKINAEVDTALSDFGKTGYSLTAGEHINIADAVLNRGASNVEESADRHSLGALVMFVTNFAVSGTTLTAKKPSDDSTFDTYTLDTTPDADPVTGVS